MKAATKSRPILFSAPMVRAILEGRKTQTRRIYKGFFCGTQPAWPDSGKGSCPYGRTGDTLWVRESIKIGRCPNEPLGLALYSNGDGKLHPDAPERSREFCREFKSVPSIHMPRWASRLTLEITDVRVERLNEISEEDAKAEGVSVDGVGNPGGPMRVHQRAFKSLWNQINGADSWAANPWVWVIEFSRTTGGAA